MSIIISRNGKDAQKVEQASFANEDHLQDYIYTNPECLPLYEIDEDIRMLILAREFPTDSGPIDALGVDRDGNLYVIETKLYKNADKRLVVAQVMDYGASLWKHTTDFTDFLAYLQDAASEKFGMGLSEKLRDFFGATDDEVSALLDNLRANLGGGRFQFVVLMDRLDDRLKDLIVFINQNSEFTVFGVELEFYRHDQYEILIPRLFGAEVKKQVSGSSGSQKRWDESSFFEAVASGVGQAASRAVERLYQSMKKHVPIVWGKGIVSGSASVRFPGRPASSFTLYSNGCLSIHAAGMSSAEADAFQKVSGLEFASRSSEKWKNFPFAEWSEKADAVIRAIDAFGEKAKSGSPSA